MFHSTTEFQCRKTPKQTAYLRTAEHVFHMKDDRRWKRLVTSFNQSTERTETVEVIDVCRDRSADMVELLTYGGDKVVCSEEQMFLTRTGFRKLSEIKIGEYVGFLQKRSVWWQSVVSIRPYAPSSVYSLRLSKNEAYIANGFIVST